MKLLCVCDSPTERTGFARVAQSLLPYWRGTFSEIDIWGINYNGWPHKLPYTIYPGGSADWASDAKLQALIDRIAHGKYSHVWVMQDALGLCGCNFPTVFRQACELNGTRSFYYAPVDAPWDPAWAAWLPAADQVVAYTHYGRAEMETAFARFASANPEIAIRPIRPIRVLPHGVDDCFRPLPNRAELRAKWFPGFNPSDVVLLNVNTNSPRKAMASTFEVLAILKQIRSTSLNSQLPCFRLVMHTTNRNYHCRHHTLTDLAPQFGLEYGRDWICTDDPKLYNRRIWVGNHAQLNDLELNELYNAADGYISTTLGEGWGLGVIEALAAGCPAAAPDHTACAEIMLEVLAAALGDNGVSRVLPLPVSNSVVASVDDSRLRHPVDAALAAEQLAAWLPMTKEERPPLSPILREWLSWRRIAREWVRLFKGQS